MIHWFSVSVPVFIPSSGLALLWLLGGLATYIWLVVRYEGVRAKIVIVSVAGGFVRIALVFLTWPVTLWCFWGERD